MQYILCPRCQFRVPLNRHLCATCGQDMPTLKQLQNNAELVAQENQTKKGKFWNTFLGLSQRETASPEPVHDEPALSS